MNLAMPEADYTVRTAADTLRVERLLPGPIERVWRYLTDAELRAQWFAGGPMEPQPGGRIELLFRNSSLTEDDDPPPSNYASKGNQPRPMVGTIIEFDPPRVLGFTFGGGESPSHVRFELSTEGEQVRLVVTHSRVATREDMVGFASGWHTHLDILRARLAGQKPEGFWRTHARLEPEYARRLS